MGGPSASVAAVRLAVRTWFAEHADLLSAGRVAVAVSGGADSRALASAALFEAKPRSIDIVGITVDHQLQEGSAARAQHVGDWLLAAGCTQAHIATVEVGTEGGPEAAARTARYAALRELADGAPVLLGHTLDDQAETVLLGLSRGAGPGSLQGMAPWRAPYGRPLLAVRRETTMQYCRDLGIDVWHDPHNHDPRFVRVRLRHEALPLLEEILGGGVAPALARTATQLREADTAETARAVLALVQDGDSLDAGHLKGLPIGLRRDVLKAWLDTLGIPTVQSGHVDALDRLVSRWRGQGPVYLPAGVKAERDRGRIYPVDADLCGRAAPTHRSAEE